MRTSRESLRLLLWVVMRRLTILLFVPVVLVMATAMSGQPAPPGTSESAAAFKQLVSLVGEWQGVQDGVEIKVTCTLTANGSALMEEDKPANSGAMITMFTVDGDHLIATHYCSVGNQPQMATRTIGDLEKDGLTFSLVRVTGMKTPEDWHNTDLTVTQEDKDHITQRWNYLYKGKAGTTIFHYARKK